MPEITQYMANGDGRRNAGYATDDGRFSVLVVPRDADDNEAAFGLATHLAVVDGEVKTLRTTVDDLRGKIVEQKAEPSRLMGDGCVRFTSTGELWLLGSREKGFTSFGFRFGSWDELFRRYNVRITGHGTDGHGEYWTAVSM